MTKEATHYDPYVLNDDIFLNGTYSSVTILAASDMICLEFSAKRYFKLIMDCGAKVMNFMMQ